MKNTALILIVIISLLLPTAAYTQNRVEPYMSADLTTAYLWRGQKNAGVSVQPVLGIKWLGLNFYVWGNEQLSPPAGQDPSKHEIDFFLKYSVTKNFTVGLKDVYVNTRGRGIFSFGPIPHAANGLDVLLHYDMKYVNFEWTTTIAGYDGYTHSGRRSYGSYLIVSAPFSFMNVDWTATVGIVPYYCSRYSEDDSNGFHMNMAALKASHDFELGSKKAIVITPYMQLMVNPSGRRAYFLAGVKFAINPTRLKNQ